ncbi:MAG: YifB family Mg chelatase-like AAA ATPase [Proteobacteria bacterium]|nr:YifB family Mg chelatase-like AAA ATPase [Pseudomonadota bacterium]
MAVATVLSRALHGVDATPVTVEVHLANGLPAFHLVGLPEAEVREARDRVRAALQNAGFEFPARRITVNLAPADLRKASGRFDLPIALGILVATAQLPAHALARHEFAGELALDGSLRGVRGVLPMALCAARDGRALVVPVANADEAALVRDACVLGAGSLQAVCAHLTGRAPLARHAVPAPTVAPSSGPDLADVRGQAHAKRALVVAAAGGHSLLLIGPPGAGKSMLAQRLPGLLPPLPEAAALEAAAVASLAGRLDTARWRERPFRAPHHTASAVALVGGGSDPRPGEISLAHRGVLFMDELPEWDRHVLETLREPLETGVVHLSRATRQASFPAEFQFVAAMNPCPCGWLGHASGRCRCTPERTLRYRSRVSGPLLDRIDLTVNVQAVAATELTARRAAAAGETAAAATQVAAARRRQAARQATPNARLAAADVDRLCSVDAAGERLLAQALGRSLLSARAFHRVLRVARTIADLDDADGLGAAHVAEAIGYRRALDGTPAAVPMAAA